MDSKQGFPPSSYDEEPAPPSYTHALSTPYSPSSPASSQYYSQQIQTQLHTLTTQISSLQTQKSLLAHAQDEKILSLLTTQIQLYLSEFAKRGLGRGNLILVPATALEEENAIPANFEDKIKAGIIEFDQLVRVRDKEGNDKDGLWFWNDEDMALRLAESLKPLPDSKKAPLPPREEEIQATSPRQRSSRGFWGRKKSKPETPPSLEGIRTEHPEMPKEAREDKVSMDVKAEEVVFRFENDFGVYESRRGWGIVFQLQVTHGQK